MRGIQTDGAKICKLRESLQLTQEDLAGTAGCDVKTIRTAEKSRRIDLATLRRIASALSVPAAAIVRPAEPAEAQAERRMSVVRRWQQAFNDRDIEAMLDCYHDNAVLDYPSMHDVPGCGVFRGKAELRRQAEITFACFDMEPITPDMYKLHAVDNYVFMRGAASATVRQTGAQFTAAAMHEFEFEGEKIVRHQGYFDTLAMESATSKEGGIEQSGS